MVRGEVLGVSEGVGEMGFGVKVVFDVEVVFAVGR